MDKTVVIHRFQQGLIAMGMLALAASLMGFAGRYYWLFELASHFRVQYFLSLALIAGVLLRRRLYPAAAFALGAAINLLTILPLYQGAVSEAVAASPSVRILSLNLNYRNEDYDGVKSLIGAYDPDVIVLQEFTPRWLQALQELQASYPNAISAPRNNQYGIALYSRLPLERPRIISLEGTDRPTVLTDIHAAGRDFTLYGIHPPPPMSRGLARQRNRQLGDLARLVRADARPTVVVGDFNTSPWSYYFDLLLQESGLQDSSRGRGVMPSWPRGYPLLWIPIDHCLFSRGIAIQKKQIGPAVGSDHYPLIVDMALSG